MVIGFKGRLLVAVVVFGVSAAEARDPAQAFCEAWTKAAATAPTSDAALVASLEAGGMNEPEPDRTVKVLSRNPDGTPRTSILQGDSDALAQWKSTLQAVAGANPADRGTILKAGARDLGLTWNCPAFEFPGGRPTAELVLDAQAAQGTVALAADDQGVYLLARQVAGTALFRVTGHTAKLLSQGLPSVDSCQPELALTPTMVVMVCGPLVTGVPRAGGSSRVLYRGAGVVRFEDVDGASVLLAEAGRSVRVPMTGAVETLSACEGKPEASRRDLLNGLCRVPPETRPRFKAFQALPDDVRRAFRMTPVLVEGTSAWFVHGAKTQANTLPPDGPLARFERRTVVAPPLGMYRYVAGSAAPERVADAWEGEDAVSLGGTLVGVGSAQWEGKQRLLSWKPGAGGTTTVASPVGHAQSLVADAKFVYWFDALWGGVYRAPRPR